MLRNGALLHALHAPVADWTAAADELIGAGVTRLQRDKVATVLAELADGTAPSTVARRVGVGYATVARIAERTRTPPLNSPAELLKRQITTSRKMRKAPATDGTAPADGRTTKEFQKSCHH